MRRMPISQFERLAQRLVEDSFKRIFGGRLEPLEVAARLAKALEDSQLDGRAADLFTIRLHPSDLDYMSQNEPLLETKLAAYVARLASQVGLTMVSEAEVNLVSDPNVGRHQIGVTAEHSRQSPAQTTQLHRIVQPKHDTLSAITDLDAFLIVEGRRHFSLDKPVISIGRRADNDLILTSPSVSRRHAQIRWRFGRFVLYDLGGRHGTAVNGEPVTEWVLRPGDVIALSDTRLIYGEGQTKPKRRLEAAGDDGSHTLLTPKH